MRSSRHRDARQAPRRAQHHEAKRAIGPNHCSAGTSPQEKYRAASEAPWPENDETPRLEGAALRPSFSRVFDHYPAARNTRPSSLTSRHRRQTRGHPGTPSDSHPKVSVDRNVWDQVKGHIPITPTSHARGGDTPRGRTPPQRRGRTALRHPCQYQGAERTPKASSEAHRRLNDENGLTAIHRTRSDTNRLHSNQETTSKVTRQRDMPQAINTTIL